VDVGQVDVEHDELRKLLLRVLQRRRPAIGDLNIIALPGEVDPEHVGDVLIILDDQEPAFGHPLQPSCLESAKSPYAGPNARAERRDRSARSCTRAMCSAVTSRSKLRSPLSRKPCRVAIALISRTRSISMRRPSV